MHTQSLESRRLLAGVSFQSGVMTIVGTEQADVVSVRVNAGTGQTVVNLNGSTSGIRGVQNIVVQTGSGDDRITIDRTVTVSTLIDAAGGDDAIMGGSGNDSILAGTGDDFVGLGWISQIDADTVDGGAGNDTLIDNDGNDVLRGGDGNDTIEEDAGTNALLGQNGDDYLSTGRTIGGASYLDGGTGTDTLDFSRNGLGDALRYSLNARFGVNGSGIGSLVPGGTVYDRDGIRARIANYDRIVAGESRDNITIAVDGAAANTTATLRRLSLLIDAGAGDDTVFFSSASVAGDTAAMADVSLLGGAGDDVFTYSSDSRDTPTTDTGAGDDTVYRQNLAGSLGRHTFGTGHDLYYINASEVANNYTMPDDLEDFVGVGGVRRLYGNDLDNFISGGGRIAVYALGGDDRILSGAPTTDGGEGNDRISVSNGVASNTQTVLGGSGDDWIEFGSTRTIVINGDAGNDRISGAVGNSATINGGAGVDRIVTQVNRSVLQLRDGETDYVLGYADNDQAELDAIDVALGIETVLP